MCSNQPGDTSEATDELFVVDCSPATVKSEMCSNQPGDTSEAKDELFVVDSSPATLKSEMRSNQPGDTSEAKDELFVVDCSPAIVKDNLDIPSYDRKFSDVLQAENLEEKFPTPKRPQAPRPQNVCWNCEGNHSVRECQERRDPVAISRNRAKFMQSTPRGTKASRYHKDDEHRFHHNQPGKISSRLLRALGLRDNQLPRHIYRMRSLGYPPGWVEEARVSHSGLVLFNSAGEEVADPGFEDGEITPAGAKDKFDVRKIIEYPGFNCQCSPNIKDETDRLNARPMTEIDSIERMISIWQPRAVRAYKRKKLKGDDTNASPKLTKPIESKHLTSNNEDNTSLDSEEDGEICDDDNSPCTESLPCMSTSHNNLKRSNSPESDLPVVKKQKVEEEACGSCDNTTGLIDDSSKTPDGTKATAATPDTPQGRVTSVSFGTPVIITSQYTNLPTPEKFSKNICDVINFENLPDSTGKYEKMSGLLKKVRSTVSKMNDDAEESDE